MSFGAILLGILIWGAFPALYKRDLSEKHYHWLVLACRYIGIAVILAGILYGFFR